MPPETPPARVPLGRKIRHRIWVTFAEAMADAAEGMRRAPGRFATQGLRGMNRVCAADPGRLLGPVAGTRRLAPRSAFLAQAEAILTARGRGWEAAAALFAREAARARPGAAAELLRLRPFPPIWPALPAATRPSFLDPEEARRIVVYTTAFDGEEAPAPLFHEPPGIRFLLLTGRAGLSVPGWETHLLSPPAPPDQAGAWARVHAEAALAEIAPEAEASLCLRPDRALIGNLHTMIARWFLPADFVLWRHSGGVDWHDLAERVLVRRAFGRPGVNEARVLAQARDCAARGLPRDRGLFDTGVIWRRHRAPEVRAVAEAWWQAFARAPGLDEISLYAALNDPALPWAAGEEARVPAAERVPAPARILPAALGPASYNALAARRFPRPPLRPRPCAPAAPVSGRPLGVAFLYAERYANSASTILRGKQLSEMVAARYPDAIDMAYTSDIDALRDRVVIVTKGALDTHSAEALEALRRRNRAVIGSWDDRLPSADKIAATDAAMGVSNRQTHDFARLFPAIRAYHVTHHVNSEIPFSTPPGDRPRTAYFGFRANTVLSESLRNMIDMIPLETARVDMSWIALLPHYNCHWIVRRSKAHDGWKPFLKGFTAARAGAVVVVGRDDEDALQYLGDDYPFYVGGTRIPQLEYDMARVASAFGGPDWALARDIMAQVADRSSDAQVCAEFRAMVEDVIS
ncbi:hypothetical protein [Amaricoccus solimangrovi]|uniref:Uncharacterized protein n=1 Tax=Amaricoccus solimangrovi TaxID=2589815 RepID=A0A501WG86_9RHOB|nr:hypothetical protein [Amaricoccus solimangrovi]TPE48408.1 hypothetical protein FJM51_17740 [Amaricoccus solimangrovi]